MENKATTALTDEQKQELEGFMDDIAINAAQSVQTMGKREVMFNNREQEARTKLLAYVEALIQQGK